MKVFLDANILVAILNKKYPIFSLAARILSLADQPKYTFYTSPVCLAISFYFAEKKTSSSIAKNKIKILLEHIQIAENLNSAILKTLNNKKVHDFEDGLEYYAAEEAGCNCILTENLKDFYFADLEVLDCKGFAEKYLIK
ncbi:twitching motility protein PilT [Pedobacter psychrophilus]|uniref:Twitching motility protein PilT n=1 Tax=Pedobacter psychrophilus TaxID=1826909 RepID=A0A179DI43_9SPHI|nr:PIN domain-containing protein [Pedobacter psychrophilus]OAQ40618.1 twitching motility protein PilT [Pedobacter psychrophilus]